MGGSQLLTTVPLQDQSDKNIHLQTRKLRLREVKELAQSHTAAGGVQQDSNSAFLWANQSQPPLRKHCSETSNDLLHKTLCVGHFVTEKELEE